MERPFCSPTKPAWLPTATGAPPRGRRGETPVLQDTGRKFRVHMLGAIDTSGNLICGTHVGGTTAEVFVTFLQQWLEESSGKIHLVVDNPSMHKTGRVQQFPGSDGARDRMDMHCLPTCSPDLNPIEKVWGHVKREVGQKTFKNMEEMHKLPLGAFEALKSTPAFIQSFFHCKECCYTIA